MKKALCPSFQMSDEATLTLANSVVAALTGNPNFPNPVPALTAVQTALNNYSISLARSKYGSREDRAQKNADKQMLIGLLRDLCNYVNSVAYGDEVILSTCGYPLSKGPQPRVLGIPQAMVENGGSGELILSTPAVEGAVTYKHQFTADPLAQLWPEITTTRSVCKIPNLLPGKNYSLRIVAIGTFDRATISNIVTKIVA